MLTQFVFNKYIITEKYKMKIYDTRLLLSCKHVNINVASSPSQTIVHSADAFELGFPLLLGIFTLRCIRFVDLNGYFFGALIGESCKVKIINIIQTS